MPIRHDEEMVRNGRLIQVGFSFRAGRDKRRHAVFMCECGTATVTQPRYVTGGNTMSCGCLCDESHANRFTTHGMSISSTYNTWCSMKARCCNQNDLGWTNYGGRKISVCERWLSFGNFLADMGERPFGMSLDRIDNEKGYFKQNCKWSTPTEQGGNKRNNRILTVHGEKKCMAEWCRELGVCDSVVHRRLSRGWSEEEAVLTPANVRRKK